MWPAILNQKDHVMNDLLSLSRLARRLGITQQWLRDQADAGKIPCLKAGNRYLFNPLAVQEALAVKAARTRQGGDHAN
jgi:excisionase family DNA binding protein